MKTTHLKSFVFSPCQPPGTFVCPRVVTHFTIPSSRHFQQLSLVTAISACCVISSLVVQILHVR